MNDHFSIDLETLGTRYNAPVLSIGVVQFDPDTGKLTEDPDYLAHGFPPDLLDFSGATPAIQNALTKAANDNIEDLEQIEDLVRRAVSNWAHRTHRRSPLVIPVIVDA